MDDTFTLHNLTISVIGDPKTFVCGHEAGPAFTVVGEDLLFTGNGRFSMYALAALLPILPAKQRPCDKTDWVTTDAFIACPDPNCGAKFKIERTGKTTFHHHEVTKVPLVKQKA
ncbi:MAG TPA: TIGR04076 family protein [Candidatus Saccharimonadales bacterium]|nr:TIGR04076 family protein [Candidatus Saccharimonadales bacterium]